MSEAREKKSSVGPNEAAWKKLFEHFDILRQIEANGRFQISAKQIKAVGNREPRLMAKFDHTFNLPRIFEKNKLAILPVTRGDYVISHFDAYHKFESADGPITRFSLPSYVQSLDASNIPSESIALNCAIATGIVADFLDDEALVPTVSGRMGSGSFAFDIGNVVRGIPEQLQVNNSQIEIDAAYEGLKGLALFEAKSGWSEDFIIRQLYYPFRVWSSRVGKTVRPIFLVYFNGIYRLYEYAFQNPNSYSSLILVKQKSYAIEEDTRIERGDIDHILQTVQPAQEPDNIPFPQADSFERVISLCEMLNGQELSNKEITDEFAFAERQTGYYTNAALYLGLVQKRRDGITPLYSLSEAGRKLLGMKYKRRQLELCRRILSHKAFSDTLRMYFQNGNMPAENEIVQIMLNSNVQRMSGSTPGRRSSSIRGWLYWILELMNA